MNEYIREINYFQIKCPKEMFIIVIYGKKTKEGDCNELTIGITIIAEFVAL